MRYLSVAETAKKWDISERSVRNYCAHGRVPGAFLTGKPGMYRKKQRSAKALLVRLCEWRGLNYYITFRKM